jgi:aminopeptidase N
MAPTLSQEFLKAPASSLHLDVPADLAAIPDFVSGAMEHWGLVTFREVTLLYEEGVSSTSNKQRVATVVGHELAHMWFGNLGKLQYATRDHVSCVLF